MSHITQAQIEHLAKLVRLELSDDQKSHLTNDVKNILDLVSCLDKVNTDDVDAVLFSHIAKSLTPMSSEVVDGEHTDDILANIQHPLRDRAVQISAGLVSE